MQEIDTTVQAAVREVEDPLERIRVFIHSHLTTLLRHQIRHVAVLTELHALSDRHRTAVLAQRKAYAAFVRTLLEDAQKSGHVRSDVQAQYLYLALLNMLNWPVFWFRRDRATPVAEVVKHFTTVFIEGALAAQARGYPRTQPESPKRDSIPRRPRQSTPERMLARAASLFSSKGYAATSTRQIASGLGMRKASLYYHIETKEDLLHAICKSSLEQIRADVEAALAGVPGPLERIEVLVVAHVTSMLRDQDKHAATIGEMHLLSPKRQAEAATLRDAYEGLVQNTLEEAQKAGMLRRDVPVKYLCLSLLGLMNRATVWHRRRGALTPPQLGNLFADIFLRGAAQPPSAPTR